MVNSDVAIVTGPAAPALEQKAAEELARYLQMLFGFLPEIDCKLPDQAEAIFVIGCPKTNPAVGQLAGQQWPQLSDQGFVLRKLSYRGIPTIVIGGGSPVATLWAVYELLEHYGVRYLLHEDVLPAEMGAFFLPQVDAISEPVQKVRMWRVMNCLPHGPETWRLVQHQQFIDQLTKLKFNGIYLALWPYHPFVHYSYQGIECSSATLNHGDPYFLDETSIGHDRVPRDNWLYNPEFAGAETYQEMLEIGQKLINNIINYAQAQGMRVSIAIQPLEFPLEFAPVLQDSKSPEQLHALTVSEHGDLTNPQHIGLVETKFNAYLDTYPQIDEIIMWLPEFSTAEEGVVKAWESFDAKLNLEPEYTLAGLIEQAEQNHLNSGGPTRALHELKSDITMLHFFNQFFDTTDLLQHARDKNIIVSLGGCGGGGVVLLPIMDRLLWPDAHYMVGSYTGSESVRNLHLWEQLDASKLPTSAILTLQDDNIGPVPQMATGNCHHLLDMMARCGWQGFYTRYWPIDELDPPAAYLARASWDNSVTPEMTYSDHASHIYGEAAVRPFNLAMAQLEQMTATLDTEYLGLFFPVPHITANNLRSTTPMTPGLHMIRGTIRRCRDIFARILELPGGSRAKEANLNHWIGRCEFAMTLLDQKEQLHLAGCARQAFAEAKTDEEKEQHRQSFEQHVTQALALGEKACMLLADHIRDDSDRGQLAAYNQFCVSEVREESAALRKEMASEESCG